MSPYNLVLFSITGVMVIVFLGFTFAAVFLPDFRETGVALATVILGALGTAFATVLGAGYATKELRNIGNQGEGEKDNDDSA